MVGVWQADGTKSAGGAGAPWVWLLAESADLSGNRNFPKEGATNLELHKTYKGWRL